MVEKIISGGQTGADRAALDVALELKIPCGGWCPKGRRAEDGRIDDRYPLKETPSTDYRVRTRLNVEESDGTLVITRGPLTGGTALTIKLVRENGKTPPDHRPEPEPRSQHGAEMAQGGKHSHSECGRPPGEQDAGAPFSCGRILAGGAQEVS